MTMLLSGFHQAFPAAFQMRGRGKCWAPGAGIAFAEQLRPTDSQGTYALTLTNVVVGSAIRIELAGDGTLVEARTAALTNEAFSIPAYGIGSPNNDLRIKVRKGSAPTYYIPYETLATAFVGSSSVYVAQVPDE